MNLLKTWLNLTTFVLLTALLLVLPSALCAQDYKVFMSEEYGFTMQYPSSWVKVEKPKGNYYVVFQSPDLTDNFRSRIHVAAHNPVKDPLSVYLQEFRNGVADLQKQTRAGTRDHQEVRLVDEGEFKCEVPGAYYFFVQAFETNLKIWMDIVIVYYKYDQTLLRVSCLAPSSVMDKLQPVFNDVLVSIKFVSEGKPSVQQSGPAAIPPPTPGSPQSPARTAPAPPAREMKPGLQPREPSGQLQPAPPSQQSIPGPRPAPRGPVGEPERPGTGIVN